MHLNEDAVIDCIRRFTQETVVQLSKGEINAHRVRVEFDLDEMDMQNLRRGATYQEIKKYVKEQTGLNVTNLNIAKMKQKHGIIERENYNLPKSEDSRQPGCPPEKEKAIEDAFRHFHMI